MYRLVFLEGPDKGRRVVVRQASVEAGSDPDLRVHLDDPAAREYHAVFIRDQGSVHVETSIDAQPFIRNGEPLGRETLQHGDVLELGRLRLQYQKMRPLVFHERRRVSRLQLLTIVASILVIAVQVTLFGLVLLRRNAPPPPTEPVVEKMIPAEPTPETEAAAVAALDQVGGPPETAESEEEDAPPEPPPEEVAAQPVRAPAEEPEDDTFDRVEIARPGPLPDLEPSVAERPPPESDALRPTAIVDPRPVRPVVEEVAPPSLEEERPPQATTQTGQTEALPRRIRIGEVAREKFKPGPGFEEARGARVVLRPRRSLGPVNPGDVRVELTFYDRDGATGDIAPSRVPTWDPAQPGGDNWIAGDEKDVLYRYDVPKGFRTREGAGTSYYGHVVRLYYRGELEDEYAFPAALLE